MQQLPSSMATVDKASLRTCRRWLSRKNHRYRLDHDLKPKTVENVNWPLQLGKLFTTLASTKSLGFLAPKGVDDFCGGS